MKKIITIALTIFMLSQIAGCTKENPTPESPNSGIYPIEGLWIGSYTSNEQSNNTDSYYSFVIKSDGTMLVETKYLDKQQLATGSWTLVGNVFTCSYSYVFVSGSFIPTTQSATATWNDSGKLTSGTFKNTSPANGVKGTFTLSRIN